MTLWGSSLYLSQAYEQVLIKTPRTYYKTSSLWRAVCNVYNVLFLLRLSTCAFIESRWFQSVPRHTLHPCQSDPQRSPHQNCVWAYCHCQRQSMTCIWTRWKAAFSDNKGLWKRSSESEQREGECCCCCCCQPVSQSRPQVVQFTLSHFHMQEERCRLSEMKKRAGS